MENVESQATASSSPTVGNRLRQAREAAGLSRADVATQTKIAERHLLAIEEDRFNDLAARTYAVGFSRAYARTVGSDEAEIAEQVRRQLDALDQERTGFVESSFEPGDPARVPPARMAWIAGAGVVVVIGLLLAFWGSFLSPEGELPDLIVEKPAPKESAAPVPVAPPTERVVNNGPVVITATAEGVWVKVTDAGGKQLLQKEMALGESWTVPQDVQGPQLRTGRPDALQLTVGGRQVPPLADRPVIMSGVSLVAADVLARGSAEAPAQQSSPAAPGSPATSAAVPTSSPATGGPTPGATGNSVSPSSRQTGANPAPRPIATRPAPASSPAPVARSEASVPSASPSPVSMIQPVSTVSE